MTTTIGAALEVETKSGNSAAPAPPNGAERRRRRRAKISAQVHVSTVNSAERTIEEVCMSVDVSRDGLLFTSRQSGFWKGQRLNVTFPYSTGPTAINQSQLADIVRVIPQGDGKFSVAVQFQAATLEAKAERKGFANAGGVTAVAPAESAKPQSIVLAVEPDARTADMMRNMLQQDGYTVLIVSTAQEALDILRTTIPAVFIAEVEAADMSGHDLCLIIKRSDRLQRVPVILLTRSAQPADYSASHQMGAVVCMAKPFQPDRLQHVVRLVAPPPTQKSPYGAKVSSSNIERTL
jgi:CheY-like chemotaxis protein